METGELLGVLGLFVGVVGIVVSVLTLRLANRDPRPVYVQSGAPLARSISGPTLEVAVRFRGEGVQRVTRSDVAFWNAGRGTVFGSDVPDSHPITFVLPDGASLLDAKVRATTRDEINFGCRVDEVMGRTGVSISFDHLDSKDGGAIEVIHDGELKPLDLAGTIARTRGKIREIRTPLWDDPGGYKGTGLMGLIFTALAAGAGVLSIVTGSTSLVVSSLVTLIVGILLLRLSWSSYKKDIRYVPEKLRPAPLNHLDVLRRRY